MNTQILNLPMDLENKISFLKTLFNFFPEQFNIPDFPAFIQNIRLRYSRCAACHQCPETDTLFNKLNYTFLQFTQISIHTKEGLEIVQLSNIIYLQAFSNYTIIHLKEGHKITATDTLHEFELLLPNPLFIRVHRSHIINIHNLSKYLNVGSVLLKGLTKKLAVSPPYRKNLLLILNKLS